MNRVLRIVFLTLLTAGCWFTAAVPALAQGRWGYVEQTVNGTINWQDGNVTVVGIGAPPLKYEGKANERPMALRAARTVAYRNLLEIIKGVQVDAETKVADFMTESDVIHAKVEGVIKGARVEDTRYIEDGTVEVTMVLNLYGRFTDEILGPKLRQAAPSQPQHRTASAPQENRPIQPQQAQQPVAAPEAAPQTVVEPAAQPGVVYTGLVIDSRGLNLKPCMSPRVLDEDGREVYGSAFADREWAVQYGMAGYSKDINAAQSNQRVTNNPLTIKALQVTGTAGTNVVIGNEAAESLRRTSETLSFLRQCRTMFVLD